MKRVYRKDATIPLYDDASHATRPVVLSRPSSPLQKPLGSMEMFRPSKWGFEETKER